jgi:hypothetical protein
MSRVRSFLLPFLLFPLSAASAQIGPPGQSVPIQISTATTTQLVAAVGSTQIYVTAWDVLANSAGGLMLVYGTQTTKPCDTRATPLTGLYNFSAQSGISRGGSVQALYVIPPGNSLCVVTSGASVSLAGSLSYTQF